VLADLAAREGIDMPIAGTVSSLLAGRIDAREAVAGLLARPLRAESGPGQEPAA
jgi:glycerol-3-phosphate dehydrogenase (NAD(P)+)